MVRFVEGEKGKKEARREKTTDRKRDGEGKTNAEEKWRGKKDVRK